MHIGILSRNPSLYSTRRLLNAATTRGHDVMIVDALRLSLRLNRFRRAGFRPPRYTVPTVDAIIPRIGASVTSAGIAVVEKFESNGVITTARSTGIALSRHKFNSLRAMAEANLPVPHSRRLEFNQPFAQTVDALGGYPIVVKVNQGTQGNGVMLAHSARELDQILTILASHGQPVLLQEFIREAAGQDLRVIVVGGRCVAAMRRSSTDGDFRSNLHLGGMATAVELEDSAAELAIQAAKLHQLDVAGVDLIQSNRGYLILELNSSPGLEGIEGSSGIDVATAIILLLERNYHHNVVEKRRKQSRHRNRG